MKGKMSCLFKLLISSVLVFGTHSLSPLDCCHEAINITKNCIIEANSFSVNVDDSCQEWGFIEISDVVYPGELLIESTLYNCSSCCSNLFTYLHASFHFNNLTYSGHLRTIFRSPYETFAYDDDIQLTILDLTIDFVGCINTYDKCFVSIDQVHGSLDDSNVFITISSPDLFIRHYLLILLTMCLQNNCPSDFWTQALAGCMCNTTCSVRNLNGLLP